jgi:hypothetical protein
VAEAVAVAVAKVAALVDNHKEEQHKMTED